ncbi:MAG TPA: LuxR C-terminal-related transcriptional regulator [Bacillota bacterium]|nr:LuxR C-terminal-related transcriptional regulator [Bacillota bacterium]
MARGYKNAEIVEYTGLSLNTIRTHTRIAYQKLNVNNSLDAVLRARQLGIIE